MSQSISSHAHNQRSVSNERYDGATDDVPDLDERARPTLVAFWLKRMQGRSEERAAEGGGSASLAHHASPYERRLAAHALDGKRSSSAT